jgi:hypothetical protein
VVRLGPLADGGIAPSLFALVERGARLRPELAAGLRGQVELRFTEVEVPVTILFGENDIRVEDGPATDPALLVAGRLADVVLLTSVPLTRGVPRPTNPRGRQALRRLADKRVRMEGSRLLGRRLLELLTV